MAHTTKDKKEYMASRYQRLKAAGVCLDCGKTPEKGVRCDSCQEKRRERRRATAGKITEEEKEKMRARYRQYKTAGLCPQCGKKPQEGRTLCERCNDNRLAWAAKNREKSNRLSAERRERLRKQVIDAYGGKCACCAEHRTEFLTIDHINGDGQEYRSVFHTVTQMRKWIIDNNYPDDLRILCMNCNLSYGLYGYCPHQKE